MSLPLAEDMQHVLAHTTGLWEALRGGRLFLTGGTGFFGKWLLESFLWANDRLGLDAEVVVLTRSASAFRRHMPTLAGAASVHFHEGDVRDFGFPEGPFTHVIHAATPSSAALARDEPETMLDIIVRGTQRTLEFARQVGVRAFLLTSSGAVYGRQPPDLSHVDEDYCGAPAHLEPRWAYGEGKRVAEQLCAIYQARFGLEAKIARCFAFVGPHLPVDAHFAIGNFIRDGLAGGPIRVAGDGTPYRSYQYAADLAIWLWTVLLRAPAGRPYNVGSDNALSIAELARRVAGYFGAEVHVARSPVAGQPAERYVPSTQRAIRELDLHCWVPLDEAIDRTARWQRVLRGEPRA